MRRGAYIRDATVLISVKSGCKWRVTRQVSVCKLVPVGLWDTFQSDVIPFSFYISALLMLVTES